MTKNIEIRNSTAEFLIFMLEGKEDGIHVMYKDETIWATQKAISQLFDVDRTVVSKHLKNIFESSELRQDSVCAKFAHTAEDGKTYNTQFYNLDAIISVGYRVNSVRATQFRQWCTFVLRQFAIRGYVLDHKRMENGAFLGVDYFEHLLAEIREIRLSERRFYQKLTDIYATAIDYNKDAPTTYLFFKKIQNKMHYAVHGHTAAELIVERADANKEHMGLTTWENAPNGKIVKTDVSVVKNYLREKELEEMGRIVNASLDMAESMAMRHIPMTMEDWAKRIDKFINLFDSPILQDSGKVSAEYAKEFAESEFEKYRIIQDRLFQSDFDRFENDSLPALDIE
ncbi:virulence RhuM family protein [Bacteroides sp. 1001136B_160425_E2]|uniref:virulence RhuM family protein n=1 Tax=Bacteroides sp. 1001136B_160425_E2 TaxID=2787083 RepID=UPI00189CEE48|nr:virulence RhuM family protein [Bacteroides sp. 1001136B_160425_E2]